MKTEFAKEILAIAYRILQEQKDGRSVDPQRINWALTIVRSNTRTA